MLRAFICGAAFVIFWPRFRIRWRVVTYLSDNLSIESVPVRARGEHLI